MGIRATLETLGAYSKDYACSLASQALSERTHDVQLVSTSFLLDNRPEDVFYNFDKLGEEARNLLKVKKNDLAGIAESLINKESGDALVSVYKAMSYVGDIEQVEFFMKGVREGDSAINLICRQKIDEILDWVEVAPQEELKQYEYLLTNLARDVVENYPSYDIPKSLVILARLGLYDLLRDAVQKGSATSVYRAASEFLCRDSHSYVAEMIMRLLLEKDFVLINFGRSIVSTRKDPKFVVALLGEMSDLPNDQIDKLGKRLDFLSYVKNIRDIILDDPITFERVVKLFAVLVESEKELLDFVLRAMNSRAPQVRTHALRILVEMDHPRSRDMAIRMLEDESNVVRLAALETLRDVEFEEKIKVISPLLGSEDRAVRREVIEQIAALSYNRYLNSFDRLDRDKQAEAAKILSKLDEHLAEKLSGELSSLDPVKRLKALKIIQLTEKGPELSNVLEELLADPDLRVRATAIRLVQFGKSISAIATLMDLLGDVDGRVRANAVEAIEELGDKRFAPAIERLVNDRDNRCRANAIKCLWSLGGRDKAESALREMLGHEDQNMRLSAVWVISEVKYEPWMELLLERLEKETSPHIRKRIKDFLLSSPGWVL